jgi:hypothetical protein
MGAIESGLEVAAVVLLGALGWTAFVYLSPYYRCRWCRAFDRLGLRCRRCRGSKLTRRLGARAAHKVALSLRQAWAERDSHE